MPMANLQDTSDPMGQKNPVYYFVIDDSNMKSRCEHPCNVRVGISIHNRSNNLRKDGTIDNTIRRTKENQFKTKREAIQCIKRFYEVRSCRQYCWFEDQYSCFIGRKRI